MYTQCSKCETVFKLSADVLRAAGGQVRCGKCGEVFSALARLAENSSAFAAGESPLELETRADRILESAVVLQVAQTVAKDYEEYAPPGVEIAQLEVLDWSEYDQADHQDSEDAEQQDPAADRSMEFTLPPGELDRIFVESKTRAPQPVPQAESQAEPPAESRAESSAESQGAPQAPPQAPLPPEAPPPSPQAAPPVALGESEPIAEPVATREALREPPVLEPLLPHPESVSADATALPPDDLISGFDVPENVRRDVLAGFEQHIRPAALVRNSPRLDSKLVRRSASSRPARPNHRGSR